MQLLDAKFGLKTKEMPKRKKSDPKPRNLPQILG